MGRRTYTVQFENVGVTATQDLFELTPADDKPVRILGLFIGQNSDVGDAAEEMLRINIIRGFTSSGSGGSAPTPQPVRRSDGAAGFAAEVNNTTKATTGTTKTMWSHSVNIRSGLEMYFPEDMEIEATQADTTIVVRLENSPTDSLSMDATLLVAEEG